ncbi:MAG TPA: hypothetical protein VJX29_03440 [Candidatus Acidoferrales bacterium]|nr:hypothetical protein [Candidatus Acidoferrales bacterium]
MKRIAGFVFLSLATVTFLAWMLTTPLIKINQVNATVAVADGSQPMPPPPFSAANATLLADGSQPMPPPPFSTANATLLADGSQPMPPPPFSVLNRNTLADAEMPVPPPLVYA